MADAASDSTSSYGEQIVKPKGLVIERPLVLAAAVLAIIAVVLAIVPLGVVWDDLKTAARFLHLLIVIIS